MKFLTEREVAALLRKSIKTVSRLRATGELPYIPGRPVTISEADLEAYIKRSTKCHERTPGHTSSRVKSFGKSASPTQADRDAAVRAHRIFDRLKKSSRISSF